MPRTFIRLLKRGMKPERRNNGKYWTEIKDVIEETVKEVEGKIPHVSKKAEKQKRLLIALT